MLSLKSIYKVALWTSVSGIVAFVIDFGFPQTNTVQVMLNKYYFFVLAIGVLSTILRYVVNWRLIKRKVFAFDLVTVLFTVVIFYLHLFDSTLYDTYSMLYHENWVKFAVIFTFIREFSEVELNYRRTFLNPAQLFIASFLSLIFLGALLLMLPNATYSGISFIDALFTSTSAVCVTGLIVVDTGSYFTELGQYLILFLIQLGGLGILTFASYFSYFFRGGATYENQLALSDITNSQKIGDVFSTLKYIILITFGIELIASILIYISVDTSLFGSAYKHLFFSLFHAISAFCNAGFSTLPNSIFEEGFRYNYALQVVITITFIFGGLGFPIVVNVLKYFKYRIKKLVYASSRHQLHRPWVLNINSRITLITTFSVTAIAFVFFLVLEYNNTLAEHSFFGKLVTTFFSAATPRTAGFNSVDTAALHFPTIMMVFLLMWIGASPASTGGGIKTSTFAIATLNILSLAKGKSKIEVFRREIADISVRRAFATISLSLIVIGFGIIMISVTDGEKDLMHIAFECFSAYSTVGLSLGITADLSSAAKFIIIITMFVGRVTMLTVVIALIKKVVHKNYTYPSEEITIN